MTFFLLLCMLYEMSGGRRTGVDLSAPHVQMKYAPVMELVDMRDLGSRAAMRVGSSPFRRTKKKDMTFGHVFLFGFRPPEAASTLCFYMLGQKHLQGARHIRRAAKPPTAVQEIRPVPRVSPAVKTLVRRKRAAGQKAGSSRS